MPAALRERDSEPAPQPERSSIAASNAKPLLSTPDRLPTTGTVVLDVEQGGIVVPSFTGKSVRSAIELAEQSGLEMDAVGVGRALEQSPPAGAHVAAGTTVTVKFGR